MKKAMILAVFLCLFITQGVGAEVVTLNQTAGYEDAVYLSGSFNQYPMEYYDKEKNAFCGIIPDFLAEISEITKIDFVYINGDGKEKHLMGENLQVDIVSSAEGGENLNYAKEYLELISYADKEETATCGLVFTKIADDKVIAKIKKAATEIPEETKNSIFLSYGVHGRKGNVIWILVSVISTLVLVGFVVFLLIRMKRIRREHEVDQMTDSETGMGNLQFFKYHFRYTIDDVSRNLYYVAYIILDSSYLRSYHGDSSFEEVLKYTFSVLSEYTGDREISARITENGFAFAFQSTNEDDAKRRMEEVMKKLNGFEGVKEKHNNKLVFHAAMYRLLSSDRNCEILLFNLRKNCMRIFGTEKQIVVCDARSMNRVQEEKKMTERILKGFEEKEFKLYLQFIVDNKTKDVVSAEGLSRWDNREKGLVGPVAYIDNMEAAGFIGKHDFSMFEIACRQLELWKDTEYRNISISCNFTRITLSEENFIDKLNMIAQSYEFDHAKLAIEITEDAMERNRKTATENVRRCKELGFKIYLDDLGSGYTSLSNLCDYPIDVVKIDRDILLKATTPRGKDLFLGIVALAHSLNIKVICEGVETEEQNALVFASECDYIQGWYYSKALPLEECEGFLDDYKKKTIKSQN